MNPRPPLLPLLEEWRRLNACEGRAIADGNWSALAGYQGRKARLREELDPAVKWFRSAWPPLGAAFDAEARRYHFLAKELMAGEARNREQLRARRRDWQVRLDQIGATLRKLNDLRRAYGPQTPAHLRLYS